MALLTGRQNSKLFGRNDPYGIIDTRQAVGYDKGKEGRGNELSPAGQGWTQPNQTKPGTPNAYAEYLAYKQKVQARQQSLALEQALQQLLVQEQAASAVAGPQAFAYNGADGFFSGGYETGSAGGTGGSGGIDGAYEAGDTFKSSGLDGGAGADRASSVGDTGEATGRILSEGEAETHKNGIYEKADYHSGQTTGGKSPAPKDGQFALDNSTSIGENTTRRVGLDSNGDFVVLDETSPGTFHGHVRGWSSDGGNQGLTQEMKNALYKAGYIKSPTGSSFKLTDYARALIGQ